MTQPAARQPNPTATLECVHSVRSVQVHSSHEVVVSSGAVNTPQLLLLSGIGPTDELRRAGVVPRVEVCAGQTLKVALIPRALRHAVLYI